MLGQSVLRIGSRPPCSFPSMWGFSELIQIFAAACRNLSWNTTDDTLRQVSVSQYCCPAVLLRPLESCLTMYRTQL